MNIRLSIIAMAFATGSSCYTTAQAQSTLNNGSSLRTGQSLKSDNGLFEFRVQEDGNLVVYKLSPLTPLWKATLSRAEGKTLTLQNDGNLVFSLPEAPGYQKNLWAVPLIDYSKPQMMTFWTERSPRNNPVANSSMRLVMEDNGDLVLYSSNNAQAWHSNTIQLGPITKTYTPTLSTNPDGPWEYGWATQATPYTKFSYIHNIPNEFDIVLTMPADEGKHGVAGVIRHRGTTETTTEEGWKVPVNSLIMSAGKDDIQAVIRFTVPEDGMYEISCKWKMPGTRATKAAVSVETSSATAGQAANSLFSNTMTAPGSNAAFAAATNLKKGQILIFKAGNGGYVGEDILITNLKINKRG